METDFTIEYLSEEEKRKPQLLQQPVVVRVIIRGEMILADAIIALIKTKYKVF